MELNKALDSIQSKIGLEGSRMTEEEASVLSTNLDNTEAVSFYAMGLLMNSTVRFKNLFFKGYDELQNEAFALLNSAIENESTLAVYLMAQIKCGLFGKFPRYPEEAKSLLRSNTPQNIVAYSLGFCSQTHFIQCFKKQCGITPNQFLHKL